MSQDPVYKQPISLLMKNHILRVSFACLNPAEMVGRAEAKWLISLGWRS